MSVNASVVAWTDVAQSDPLAQDFRILERIHLEPGASYVVLAKGEVFAWVAEATLRLEAFDATDETKFTQGAYPPIFQGGHGSFMLTIATTLPDDDELYVDATLSARTAQGLSIVRNVKMIALAVDSLSVTTH